MNRHQSNMGDQKAQCQPVEIAMSDFERVMTMVANAWQRAEANDQQQKWQTPCSSRSHIDHISLSNKGANRIYDIPNQGSDTERRMESTDAIRQSRNMVPRIFGAAENIGL